MPVTSTLIHASCMRPLISYDDLTDSKPPKAQSAATSPPKRNQKPNFNAHKKSRHSDGNPNSKVFAIPSEPKSHSFKYGIQEESRQLTHAEIWDDTALIEAWSAAAEEFEVLNGPDKSWKTEPVHKSPLWYNIPPKEKDIDTSEVISTMMPSIPAAFASHFESSEDMEVEETDNPDEDEENSRPVDFETFVPQHDPSLSSHQNVADKTPFAQVIPSPPQSLSSMSVDQAFQNATGAWYWAGYWTGIYHATSRSKAKTHQGRDHGHQEREHGNDNEAEGGNVQVPAAGAIADQTDLIPT